MTKFDLSKHSYYACIQRVGKTINFGFYQGILPKVVPKSSPFQTMSVAIEYVKGIIEDRKLTKYYQIVQLNPVEGL